MIFFQTFEKHCEHLNQIFKLFKLKRIMLAFKKSFIGFFSITLLNQKIDSLKMLIIDDKIKIILFLFFSLILKKLDYFFSFIDWLCFIIERYVQFVSSLQMRKTDLTKNINKIKKIVSKSAHHAKATKTHLNKPIQKELKSFRDIQNAFRKKSYLIHFKFIKSLFVNIDASKKNKFAAMIYHLKSGFIFFKADSPQASPSKTDVQLIMFLNKLLNQTENNY